MKILVMSGGAAKGAYTSGALRYLLNDLEINYQGVCGISVGALNAAVLAQFSTGQEKTAYAALDSLWKRIDTSKIYKRWFPFGRLHGLWKSSLYDSSPLLNWINSELNIENIRTSGKIVNVGAVSLTTGKYKIFDQNYPDFAKAVAASASYPAMFIPIEMEGQLWSDGGIQNITPVQAAINLGATEIDIIITSPIIDSKHFSDKPSALDVANRTLDLMTDEIISNDIADALYYNELVLSGKTTDKRFIKINIIRPDKDLTDNSLDFTPALLNAMAEIGYEDAKKKYNI